MSDQPIRRRPFLKALGLGSAGLAASAVASAAPLTARPKPSAREWKPVSDRKIRFGIVGYGVCRFGAQFGFQNHPS